MQDTQNQQTQQNDGVAPMPQDPFMDMTPNQADEQFMGTVPTNSSMGQTAQPIQNFGPVQNSQSAQTLDPTQTMQTANPAQGLQTPQITNPAQDLQSAQVFDPAQSMQSGQPVDPATDQAQAPISVHTGTPESAPIPVAPEAPVQGNVEYGYEKLRQIENAGLELEKIENKESLNQKPQDEIQSEPRQQDPPPVVPQVKPPGPKIFGYYIPANITSNLSNIRAKKGTGDPQDARTWIYVLLDKLLKKQTYQQSDS